ncbi:MAG: winged helix-turn-helix domain-containing protein [Bryobacteraceae bacterium]
MSGILRDTVIRFGAFELDPNSGELRKHGIRIKLQDQPRKILVALLEDPGGVVTRDELRQRIWGNETFVDFDHGLSAAVNRLREALGDSADKPRFVETLARRGYRFIAPVEGVPRASDPAPPIPHWTKILIITAVLAAGAAIGLMWMNRGKTPAPNEPIPLTTYDGGEQDPSFSPDGSQVAFSWNGANQDNFDIFVKVVGTESLIRLTSDLADDRLPAWSPDGRFVAFLRRDQGVYLVPSLGGTERKIGEWPGMFSQFSWSSDSRTLLVARSQIGLEPAGIFMLPVQGGPVRRLTAAEGSGHDQSPAISRDDRRLAFASCPGVLTCAVALLEFDRPALYLAVP